MRVFGPHESTVENYNRALSDPNSRVVFVGHTQHDPSTGTTNAIQLGNGSSMGTSSTSQNLDMTTAPPTLFPMMSQSTTVSAGSVSLFGCDSASLANQYSGAGLFVGMDSGADRLSSLQAMGPAAAAWVSADAVQRPASSGDSSLIGPPVNAIDSANAAFNQNASSSSTPVPYTDFGDRVVQPERNPQQ